MENAPTGQGLSLDILHSTATCIINPLKSFGSDKQSYVNVNDNNWMGNLAFEIPAYYKPLQTELTRTKYLDLIMPLIYTVLLYFNRDRNNQIMCS